MPITKHVSLAKLSAQLCYMNQYVVVIIGADVVGVETQFNIL